MAPRCSFTAAVEKLTADKNTQNLVRGVKALVRGIPHEAKQAKKANMDRKKKRNRNNPLSTSRITQNGALRREIMGLQISLSAATLRDTFQGSPASRIARNAALRREIMGLQLKLWAAVMELADM
jgi:hypothetical protein